MKLATFNQLSNMQKAQHVANGGIVPSGAYIVQCPVCKSANVTQTADHASHGYNGYVCNDCGAHFGN